MTIFSLITESMLHTESPHSLPARSNHLHIITPEASLHLVITLWLSQ